MSDPRTKEERSKAKDIRQGITEQRPVIPHEKKKKKYAVKGKWTITFFKNPDTIIGKYATLKDAEKALKSAQKVKWYKDLHIEEL